jgi:phosphohistidine phosphatase SixA
VPKTRSSRQAESIVCVLRHGDAGAHVPDSAKDRARPLTAKGRRQSERAGRVLRALGLRPDVVVTSALPRAVETADHALASIGDASVPRVRDEALEPEAPPEDAARALAAARKSLRRAGRARSPNPLVVWVVGHDPSLSRLLSFWTGEAAVALRKGALALVEFPGSRLGAGDGTLRLLLQPRDAKAMRRAR